MSVYQDVLGHGAMIFDHVRNHAYEKAILANVNENSVVLDLGSGLGLHGLMAAKAGAKKVYLVDPSPAVLLAGKIAKENGLNNVECIQGCIEDLSIEKVDIIISVFTGNFLLTEDLLPSLFYARDNFLKPKGVLIPERAKMIAMPISADRYYQSAIDRWTDNGEKSLLARFGLSYKGITQYAQNSLRYDDFTKTDWTALASEKVLCELDFYNAKKAECFQSIKTVATSSGCLHGWLGWFDMMLSGDWLSTSPEAEKLHWSQVFIPAMSVVEVDENDLLLFDIKRPEYGDWTWVIDNLGKADIGGEHNEDSTGSSAGKRIERGTKKSAAKRQSTFLSAPISMTDIQKKSPAYHASLSTKGEILKQLLMFFDGKKTNKEIAEHLMNQYSDDFPDLDAATRYVQRHITSFC